MRKTAAWLLAVVVAAVVIVGWSSWHNGSREVAARLEVVTVMSKADVAWTTYKDTVQTEAKIRDAATSGLALRQEAVDRIQSAGKDADRVLLAVIRDLEAVHVTSDSLGSARDARVLNLRRVTSWLSTVLSDRGAPPDWTPVVASAKAADHALSKLHLRPVEAITSLT